MGSEGAIRHDTRLFKAPDSFGLMPNVYKDSLDAWQEAKRRYNRFLEGVDSREYPPLDDAMDLMIILPVEDWSCIGSTDEMDFSEFDIDEVLASW